MKVAAIVGPTAVGKTEVAVRVAEALNAEIVSIDSMQVYRYMDIGTAKPSAEQRRRVPHHLLDLRDPSHDLTVAEFQELARTAVEEISARNKLPLLVGGSGLYFRAVVDELELPPHAQEVRAALETELEDLGVEALYERLQELDADAAARIERNNARRIIRALEVIEITGRPFSENRSWELYESRYELAVAGLTLPRERLYPRIRERVAQMVASGLIEEARRIQARGMSKTAAQALGYRQIVNAPEDAAPEELIDEITRATKRFARRQDSWFKADPRVVWFYASNDYVDAQLIAFFRRALALPLFV